MKLKVRENIKNSKKNWHLDETPQVAKYVTKSI